MQKNLYEQNMIVLNKDKIGITDSSFGLRHDTMTDPVKPFSSAVVPRPAPAVTQQRFCHSSPLLPLTPHLPSPG